MKYRLIKQVNNAANGFTTYVIEKKVRFLFWTWWSRNYLFDIDGCHEFTEEDKAINMLSILNKEKQWMVKHVIA